MKRKGFTLLEVIIAVFIMVVGTGAAFALIQQTLSATPVIKDKLIAAYLAQEGIEIIRNMRDSAWLASRGDPNVKWDDYIPEGDWQADYTADRLENNYNGAFLNIDSNGFYSYSFGTATHFKRKINIQKENLDADIDPEKINISVRIDWSEKGRDHYFEASESIQNWYGE